MRSLETRRRWLIKNAAYVKRKAREWREAHPGYASKWLKENGERKGTTNRAWRENNKDRARETNQKWYANNAERVCENSRKWYKENRERKGETQRLWRKENPEKYRAIVCRRRARTAGGGGSHTEGEWLVVCASYGNRCLCCGVGGKMTVDHVVPLSRGGSDSIGNLQPLCMTCNLKKATASTDYRPLKQIAMAL